MTKNSLITRAFCISFLFFVTFFSLSDARSTFLARPKTTRDTICRSETTNLVVSLDGTFTFVDARTRMILFSVPTGLPIFYCHHELEADEFIDYSDDWVLHRRDKRTGIVETFEEAEARGQYRNGLERQSTVVEINIDLATGSYSIHHSNDSSKDERRTSGNNDRVKIVRIDKKTVRSGSHNQLLWLCKESRFTAKCLCARGDKRRCRGNLPVVRLRMGGVHDFYASGSTGNVPDDVPADDVNATRAAFGKSRFSLPLIALAALAYMVYGSNVLAKLVGSLDFGSIQIIDRLMVYPEVICRKRNDIVIFEGTIGCRRVAVKRIPKGDTKSIEKEIGTLERVDHHANIIRLVAVKDDLDYVYLAMERCLCSLSSLIQHYAAVRNNTATRVVLPREIIGDTTFHLWKTSGQPTLHLLSFLRDIIQGIRHLHRFGFVHRDIRPENILISKDEVFIAKVSGLGSARHFNGGGYSSVDTNDFSTPGWQAPEVLANGVESSAMDIFGLACIIFYALTMGNHPFGEANDRVSNVIRGAADLQPLDNVPEALDLVRILLNPNPQDRPTATEILRHPLLWGSQERLDFFAAVSDFLDLRRTNLSMINAVEQLAGSIFPAITWDQRLDSAFMTEMNMTSHFRPRPYNHTSVVSLLRLIRNCRAHHQNFSAASQAYLGTLPEGVDTVFRDAFPPLMMLVYRVMELHHGGDPKITKFY